MKKYRSEIVFENNVEINSMLIPVRETQIFDENICIGYYVEYPKYIEVYSNLHDEDFEIIDNVDNVADAINLIIDTYEMSV